MTCYNSSLRQHYDDDILHWPSCDMGHLPHYSNTKKLYFRTRFFYTVRITVHSCCEKSLLCNRSLKTDVKIKSKIAWTYKNSYFSPWLIKIVSYFSYPYENIYGGNGRFSLLQFLLGVTIFSMDSSRLAESLRMIRKLSQCGLGVHSHIW